MYMFKHLGQSLGLLDCTALGSWLCFGCRKETQGVAVLQRSCEGFRLNEWLVSFGCPHFTDIRCEKVGCPLFNPFWDLPFSLKSPWGFAWLFQAVACWGQSGLTTMGLWLDPSAPSLESWFLAPPSSLLWLQLAVELLSPIMGTELVQLSHLHVLCGTSDSVLQTWLIPACGMARLDNCS